MKAAAIALALVLAYSVGRAWNSFAQPELVCLAKKADSNGKLRAYAASDSGCDRGYVCVYPDGSAFGFRATDCSGSVDREK